MRGVWTKNCRYVPAPNPFNWLNWQYR